MHCDSTSLSHLAPDNHELKLHARTKSWNIGLSTRHQAPKWPDTTFCNFLFFRVLESDQWQHEQEENIEGLLAYVLGMFVHFDKRKGSWLYIAALMICSIPIVKTIMQRSYWRWLLLPQSSPPPGRQSPRPRLRISTLSQSKVSAPFFILFISSSKGLSHCGIRQEHFYISWSLLRKIAVRTWNVDLLFNSNWHVVDNKEPMTLLN